MLVLLVVRHGEDVMRCEGEVEGLCKIRERCEGKKYQISISTKTTEIAEILLVRLRPISPACAGIGPVLCCHYLTIFYVDAFQFASEASPFAQRGILRYRPSNHERESK